MIKISLCAFLALFEIFIYLMRKQHKPDFAQTERETYMTTRTPHDSIGNTEFLLKRSLIDEFVISIVPVFLANGIRLSKTSILAAI